jgi:hypothetical protein
VAQVLLQLGEITPAQAHVLQQGQQQQQLPLQPGSDQQLPLQVALLQQLQLQPLQKQQHAGAQQPIPQQSNTGLQGQVKHESGMCLDAAQPQQQQLHRMEPLQQIQQGTQQAPQLCGVTQQLQPPLLQQQQLVGELQRLISRVTPPAAVAGACGAQAHGV